MTGDRTNYIEIDLLQLLKALRRRVWAILLATVLFGGAAFTYATVFITPRYQASALMYVNNSSFSLGSTSFSISSSELTAAQSLVGTYIVILNTRTTLEDVIQKAGVSYTYEELSGMVNASAVNATEIFEVTVTSEDPQEAELIANTIAEVLPGKISDVVEGSSVRVVDYAVVPAGKASPNSLLAGDIGMMAGPPERQLVPPASLLCGIGVQVGVSHPLPPTSEASAGHRGWHHCSADRPEHHHLPRPEGHGCHPSHC